jgi:hypothetical protein
MRRRIAALLMVVGFLLATAAPVSAQGEGGCDANPGASEGSSSPNGTPPQGKPGHLNRDTTATEHDPSGSGTGFGNRVLECA